MATTTFIDGDLSQSNRIVAAWLNDVDDITYRKCAEWISVKDPAYGYSGSGAVSAATFQAAINAAQGTSAYIIIPGNTTIALGSTPITSSGALRIVGFGGQNRVAITSTISNGFVWTHTAGQNGGLQLEGITFTGPVGCTAGGLISISGDGITANDGTYFNNCTFNYGYDQIYMPSAYVWRIVNCTFNGAVNTAIYTENTINQDAGDSYIHNCLFSNLGVAATAIKQGGSGGLKILQNKIFGGLNGYVMDLVSGALTSILLIEGNSIEYQSGSCIRMRNTAGSAGFSQTVINGNQFAGCPTPINLDSSTAFSVGTIISNNVIVALPGAGTTCAITLTTAPLGVITGNLIYGSGSTVLGISIGLGSTATREYNNTIYGCVTEVLNDCSNGVASAASITLPSWTDTIIVSGTTNITSIASASNHRNRTVTLVFQGSLTFTDGNNLLLAGNFVTSQHDTITLTCADGTNWYEVCRSVN